MDRILWYSRMIFIHRGLTQDIANCFRAVRAMNETLKQNRLLQERGEDRPFTRSSNDNTSDLPKNVHFSDFYKWGLKFIYLFSFAFLIFRHQSWMLWWYACTMKDNRTWCHSRSFFLTFACQLCFSVCQVSWKCCWISISI